MPNGKQWIHMDAQYPLKFGHDLCQRFGPAGELLFILFLCACKRSYPQGQIHYRDEEELRVLLFAHFPFEDEAGDKWCVEDFWRYCGRRKVTSTKTRGGRLYVTATRWDAWEDDFNATERRYKAKLRQQKRRSEAKNVTLVTPQRLEVRGKRLEVRGGSAEGGAGLPPGDVRHAGNAAQELIEKLMRQNSKANPDADE